MKKEPRTPTKLSPGLDPTPRTASTAFHAVNKTDPYYVAGHPREKDLQPPPFPHAAVKESKGPKLSIDEELAALNPPLYVPANKPEDKSTSLKRRHTDNLTTILHRCKLNGDWQRASRAWSLLIRTEIAGRGIDVRRNGRWSIGAELLMKLRKKPDKKPGRGSPIANEDVGSSHDDADSKPDEHQQFSEDGFKLAREYYERLILQYPHTPRTQQTFNATVIYPALFNIWIYEVQDRSKRARRTLASSASISEDDETDSWDLERLDVNKNSRLGDFRREELAQALPIAQRMDDLLLSPPYDTTITLLQLRGMLALWISDLHSSIAETLTESPDEEELSSMQRPLPSERHLEQGTQEREKAKTLFEKVAATGVKLPREVRTFAWVPVQPGIF